VREVIAACRRDNGLSKTRGVSDPHIVVAIKGTEAGGYGAYLKDGQQRLSERTVQGQANGFCS